ncbi:hypothetical protein TWF694_008287 [Orbilia ellipsospora]|uniref:Lipoprotein n=1 Tax=Orbilia ellipsospora TaxID=2528407 RepID=A0AAV9XMB2_9PEZI
MKPKHNIRYFFLAFTTLLLSSPLACSPLDYNRVLFDPIIGVPKGLIIPADALQPGGVGQFTAALKWLDYYSLTCEMGLYEDHDLNDSSNKARWQGLPFGDGSTNATAYQGCIDIGNLYPPLVHKIRSYIVTGWCDCSFYADGGCSQFLFNAYNRADGDLSRSGSSANQIGSYKCKSTFHHDTYVPGTLEINNAYTDGARSVTANDGAPEDPLQDFSVTLQLKDFKDLTAYNGWTNCSTIDAPLYIARWKITGVSCSVFGSNDCTGDPLIAKGNAGVTQDDNYSYSVKAQRAASYQCYMPFGIKQNLLPGQSVNA